MRPRTRIERQVPQTLLALVVLVSLLASGCSKTHSTAIHASGDRSGPAGSTVRASGAPVADAPPSGPTSSPATEAATEVSAVVRAGRSTRLKLGGWSIGLASTSTNGTLAIARRPSLPATALHALTGRAGSDPVKLTLDGASFPAAGATLTRVLGQALPSGAAAGLAYWDPGSSAWVPVETTLSADRRVLTAHPTHFSIWDWAYLGFGKLSTKRVNPPSCEPSKPSWLKTTVYLDDRNNSVLWCAGRDPDHHERLLVKVRNNRAYGLIVRSAGAYRSGSSSLGDGTGMEDVLKTWLAGLLHVPQQLVASQGPFFLPPGTEVDLAFDEQEVRGVEPEALVTADMDLQWVISGLLYEELSDAVGDVGPAGVALLAGIATSQCLSDVNASRDDFAELTHAALTCAGANADKITDAFIGLAAGHVKDLPRAAVLLRRVLVAVAAWQLGAQIGEGLSDALQVPALARTFHAYAIPFPRSQRAQLSPDGLGPLKVGMTFAQARAVLNGLTSRSTCPGSGSDQTLWAPNGNSTFPAVLALDGVLNLITLDSRSPGWRTTSGIGLGSTASQVATAYPQAQHVGGSEPGMTGYEILHATNSLLIDVQDDKVVQIKAGDRFLVEAYETCG